MTQRRNGEIDFWRFVFAVILVIYHSHMLDIHSVYGRGFFPLYRGSLAVEFFLLTSGFLMAKSLSRTPDKERIRWEDTWGFTKHKIMGFFPAFAICWTITFIVSNIVKYSGPKALARNVFRSIFEVTLTRNAGFEIGRVLPQAWYLSAMVIVMFLLYPIYAKNKKRFEYYIAPAVGLLLIGYLCFTDSTLLDPSYHLTWTYRGNLRALAEICLGVVCYVLCEKLKGVNWTKLGRVFLLLSELFGYAFVILYMHFYNKFPDYFQFVVLFFMAEAVIITFSELTPINAWFSHRIFGLLGRYSLYLYLIFMLFIETLPRLFPDMEIRVMIVVYVALTFVGAAVVMVIEKPILCVWRRFKALFVKPKAIEEA